MTATSRGAPATSFPGYTPKPGLEVPFTYSGALAATSASPPWSPQFTMRLRSVRGVLGTAGTTDSTIQVRRDGSTIATLTMPAGATHATVDVDETFTATDRLQLAVATAGTGAADLVAVALFT